MNSSKIQVAEGCGDGVWSLSPLCLLPGTGEPGSRAGHPVPGGAVSIPGNPKCQRPGNDAHTMSTRGISLENHPFFFFPISRGCFLRDLSSV